MKLINVADPHIRDVRFRPQTPAQYSSCTPVVDYHLFQGNQHYSERFQTNASFLWTSAEETLGFGSLEHYKSHKIEAPPRRI